MSSKHTPGPWKAKRLIDRDGEAYSTLYQAHIDVGPCMIWAPIGNQEAEANARLIAAAPELLDACKALLCMLDRGGEPRKIDEALTWRENDEKARKMAVDAIRKATGE